VGVGPAQAHKSCSCRTFSAESVRTGSSGMETPYEEEESEKAMCEAGRTREGERALAQGRGRTSGMGRADGNAIA